MSDFFFVFVYREKDTAEEKTRNCRKFCLDIPPELQVVSVEIKEVTVVIIKKEVCPYSYN